MVEGGTCRHSASQKGCTAGHRWASSVGPVVMGTVLTPSGDGGHNEDSGVVIIRCHWVLQGHSALLAASVLVRLHVLRSMGPLG
jgi:hypothetical protein